MPPEDHLQLVVPLGEGDQILTVFNLHGVEPAAANGNGLMVEGDQRRALMGRLQVLLERGEGSKLKLPRVGARSRRVEQDEIPGAKAFDTNVSIRARLDLRGEEIGTVVVARDAKTGTAEAVDALAEIAVSFRPFVVHEIASEQNRIRRPTRCLRQRQHLLEAIASAVAEQSTFRFGVEMEIGQLEKAQRLRLPLPSVVVQDGVVHGMTSSIRAGLKLKHLSLLSGSSM